MKKCVGGYDVVILQEDISELTEHNVASFFEQARLFDQEIRALGAKSVLFMAWPYEHLNWVTPDQTSDCSLAGFPSPFLQRLPTASLIPRPAVRL